MPEETAQAIEWSLQQEVVYPWGQTVKVSKDNPPLLVDYVRQYFNDNNIDYNTFSYSDLLSYFI